MNLGANLKIAVVIAIITAATTAFVTVFTQEAIGRMLKQPTQQTQIVAVADYFEFNLPIEGSLFALGLQNKELKNGEFQNLFLFDGFRSTNPSQGSISITNTGNKPIEKLKINFAFDVLVGNKEQIEGTQSYGLLDRTNNRQLEIGTLAPSEVVAYRFWFDSGYASPLLNYEEVLKKITISNGDSSLHPTSQIAEGLRPEFVFGKTTDLVFLYAGMIFALLASIGVLIFIVQLLFPRWVERLSEEARLERLVADRLKTEVRAELLKANKDDGDND
jgi:hypothetical protein